MSELWFEYVRGKQTYKQLAEKHECSEKTIQRKLDLYKLPVVSIKLKPVIVLMDTTYWGRDFGVMLFKVAITNDNLLKYFVKNETNSDYIIGILFLEEQGFIILGIVCDGRKGILTSFKDIPVQMCQFHQKQIIRRYLTKKPKLEASVELLEVVDLMTVTDKESFIGALNLWFIKWQSFKDERTINEVTLKSSYTPLNPQVDL